jgi:hypothetical protein
MKNKFLLFLSVVFLGIGQIWGQTYELVTSDTQLEEGAEYLILGKRSNNTILVMTTTQNNNNRGGVVISGTTLPTTLEAEANYAVFELGLSDGHWTFYDAENEGFLYAASSSSNHLRTRANDSDGNSRWEINIENDNIASVVAQGTNSRKVMQLNNANDQDLFACYGSASQAPVYLYKKGVASTDPILNTSETELTGLGYMEGNSSVSQSFSLSGMNLEPTSGNITVTAPANFQVSTDDVNFSNSLNISYSGGTLASTDVYVRLNESLAINTYTGNITISGGGASDATVSVEGMVTAFSTECGFEDFNSATLTSSYADGSFVGNNGITWTYGHSRNEDTFPINDNGLMLRRASDSYLEATISGSIGTFSFDYRKAFTGDNDRQLELLIDGVPVATTAVFGDSSGADATIYNFIYDINTTETVTIRIKNVGSTTSNRQTVIDNITWTCYSGTQPTTPTLTTSVTELSDFIYGLDSGPSASQNFVLSGENLDGSADVTLLADTDFEISLNDVDYFEEETLSAYDGTATDIYVRLKSGLPVDTYSGIILIGGYGTDAEVSVYGEVTAPVSSLFRSKANGDWTSTATWESSVDGTEWWDASTYPGATAESVVIQAEHTVNINSSAVTITNTQVYGTLEVTTPDAYSVSGEQDGVELFIKDGGVFLVNSPGNFVIPDGNAFGLVETGGKIIAGPDMGSGTDFVDAYIGYWNGIFYFGDAAICEWANSTTTLGSSSPDDYDFFFPYEEDDMPIFRVTSTPTFAFGTNNNNNIFYSILEIVGETTSFSVENSGQKTFVGGVRGSGKLIMKSNSGPVIIGNSEVVPELGGTATIVTNITDDRLRFPNGANVTAGSVFTIENSENTQNIAFERQEDFNIHGTLDITNMRITNTAPGGVFVKDGGTLRTRHTGGLFGGGSAIVNDTNFTMETGSTVEYYADVAQAISSGKEYYHLIFSGNGTKNPQNVTNVNTNGSILITGNPTVDYTTRNLGSPDGNSTDFTMDGGKLIIGTGGTQPRPGGIYNITAGAIEFTGNSITSIKVSPEYHDVIISGQNITPGGKGFTIKNVLSVTPSGDINIPSTPDTETPYVVTAQKGVQVEEGGQLTFENNATLLQDVDADNTGNIIVHRESKPMVRQDATGWSSPVSGQNVRNFSPGTLINRFYIYNGYNVGANGSHFKGIFEDTENYPMPPTIPEEDWPHDGLINGNQFNPATYTFKPGWGYSIRVKNNHTSTEPGESVTGIFTGTPHNGSYTVPAYGKYTMVGNPYPSAIEIDKFFTGNTDVDAIHVWTHVYPTSDSENYNSNYSTITRLGGGGNTVPGSSPMNDNIAIGQGFVVEDSSRPETTDTLWTINFNNGMRVADRGIFQRNIETTEKHRFWLNVYDITTDLSIAQVLLGYMTGATNDYDHQLDGRRMGSAPLYSLIDEEKYTVQARALPFSEEDIIPLGISPIVFGKYKIEIDRVDGLFDEGQEIYLKDNYLQTLHNLSLDGGYEFEAEVGEFHDRFEIVFKPEEVMETIESELLNNLLVYHSGENLVIESKNERILSVELYDLNGKSVHRNEKVNAHIYQIHRMSLATQVLIVKVLTENGEIRSKKIINQ